MFQPFESPYFPTFTCIESPYFLPDESTCDESPYFPDESTCVDTLTLKFYADRMITNHVKIPVDLECYILRAIVGFLSLENLHHKEETSIWNFPNKTLGILLQKVGLANKLELVLRYLNCINTRAYTITDDTVVKLFINRKDYVCNYQVAIDLMSDCGRLVNEFEALYPMRPFLTLNKEKVGPPITKVSEEEVSEEEVSENAYVFPDISSLSESVYGPGPKGYGVYAFAEQGCGYYYKHLCVGNYLVKDETLLRLEDDEELTLTAQDTCILHVFPNFPPEYEFFEEN